MVLFSCSERTCGKHSPNRLVFFKTIFFCSSSKKQTAVELWILRLLVSFCCTALIDSLHLLLTCLLGCKLRGCFSHCSGTWRSIYWLMEVCSLVLLVFMLPRPMGLVIYMACTRCTSGYAILYQGLRYNVIKVLHGCLGALTGWRWLMGMRIAIFCY